MLTAVVRGVNPVRASAVAVGSLLAVVAMVGCADDVQLAAERIEALDVPTIDRVQYEVDWLDGNSLMVQLVAGASDADARSVWCDVLLPIGIDEEALIVVLPQDDFVVPADVQQEAGPGALVAAEWKRPDCASPDDVPALSYVYLVGPD
jgi:hypothetical protein